MGRPLSAALYTHTHTHTIPQARTLGHTNTQTECGGATIDCYTHTQFTCTFCIFCTLHDIRSKKGGHAHVCAPHAQQKNELLTIDFNNQPERRKIVVIISIGFPTLRSHCTHFVGDDKVSKTRYHALRYIACIQSNRNYL